MALHQCVHFQAFYDNNEFCGLIYYVVSAQTVYVVYLAISPDLRNRGYGTRVLQQLRARFPERQLTLDIEPVIKTAKNYCQRVRRLHFYEQNGFHQTASKLIDSDGQFQLLTTARQLNIDSTTVALKQMSSGYYHFKIE